MTESAELPQQMDVVRRYGTSYDYHVARLADLPNQVPRRLRYPAPQDLMPVFRTPDHVVFQVKNHVRTMPVVRHPPHSRRDRAVGSGPLTGGGIRPGGRS